MSSRAGDRAHPEPERFHRPYRAGVWIRFMDPVLIGAFGLSGVGLLVAFLLDAAGGDPSWPAVGIAVFLLAGCWISWQQYHVGVWVTRPEGAEVVRRIRVRGLLRRTTFDATQVRDVACVASGRGQAYPALWLDDGTVVRVRSLEKFSPLRIGGDSPERIVERLQAVVAPATSRASGSG